MYAVLDKTQEVQYPQWPAQTGYTGAETVVLYEVHRTSTQYHEQTGCTGAEPVVQ
jgi:hypothetical protein